MAGGVKASRRRGNMYTSDFQSKLKKLNPRLYINFERVVPINDNVGTTGIYLRDSHIPHGLNSFELHYIDNEMKLALDNARDRFICGCSVPIVPEYDVKYDGKLVARGYRSILRYLVKLKLVDFDKAAKVFSCSSFMEY